MTLNKRRREQLISDYLFGIEDPDYVVKQKNDGGWLVKRRKKKSVFKKPKVEEVPEPKKPVEPVEEKEPMVEKPKYPLYDDVSLDEIAQRLLDKINILRGRKDEAEPESKKEEPVDVDETELNIEPPTEKEPKKPYEEPVREQVQEDYYPVYNPLRRRNVRLY
jgi:hypothetical protein